jgi:hypothetical protein
LDEVINERINTSSEVTGGRNNSWHTGDLKSTHTLSVQASAPGNPEIGDLWVDVS